MKKPIFSANGDASADVIIVGSGIVGGMMADQLVSQGYSVLVLEAALLNNSDLDKSASRH